MDNEKDNEINNEKAEEKAESQPQKEGPKAQTPPKESQSETNKEPKKEPKPVSPEILDLAEKVAGDPKSRLFVHLAEEYLKINMVEEALSVLNDGLKAHPNFLSARVMLGRAKLEKGEVEEAKSIFEEVAANHPDNLLVQRKLAGIYKDEGKPAPAKRACQAVLALNPKDEEMLSVLKTVEEMEKAGGGPVDVSGAAGEAQEMIVEQTSHAENPAPQAPPAENPGTSKPPAPASPPETPKVSQDPMFEPTTAGKPGSSGGGPSGVPTGKAETPQKDTAGTPTPTPKPKPDTPKVMGSSLREIGGAEEKVEIQKEPFLETNALSKTGSAQPSGAIPEAAPKPVSPASPPSGSPETPPPSSAGGGPLEEMESEALADLYIKQGHLEKGVAIFRKLLAEDPGNQGLHKKLEEAVQKIRDKSGSGPRQAPPPTEKKRSEPSSPPLESGPSGEGESKDADKIKRLQNWLDSIKKGQKE